MVGWPAGRSQRSFSFPGEPFRPPTAVNVQLAGGQVPTSAKTAAAAQKSCRVARLHVTVGDPFGGSDFQGGRHIAENDKLLRDRHHPLLEKGIERLARDLLHDDRRLGVAEPDVVHAPSGGGFQPSEDDGFAPKPVERVGVGERFAA